MKSQTINFQTNGINYSLVTRTISLREHGELGNDIRPDPKNKKLRGLGWLLDGSYNADPEFPNELNKENS